MALQCRRDDAATRDLLAALNDPDTAECVAAEREVVAALQGDCHSPIAALATIEAGAILLRVAVGGRDGTPPVLRAEASAPRGEGHYAVTMVTAVLEARGVGDYLRGNGPH